MRYRPLDPPQPSHPRAFVFFPICVICVICGCSKIPHDKIRHHLSHVLDQHGVGYAVA